MFHVCYEIGKFLLIIHYLSNDSSLPTIFPSLVLKRFFIMFHYLPTYLPIMNFDNKNDMKFIHHQTRVIQEYASVTYVVGSSVNQLHN